MPSYFALRALRTAPLADELESVAVGKLSRISPFGTDGCNQIVRAIRRSSGLDGIQQIEEVGLSSRADTMRLSFPLQRPPQRGLSGLGGVQFGRKAGVVLRQRL